jgi:hypothetical protein
VLGSLWGGGEGAYPISKDALSLTATNAEELRDKVLNMMNTSSIDGGMGFEYEQGFIIMIEEVETITQNGFEYKRIADIFVMCGGDLTDDQEEFLLDSLFNYA